MQTENQHLKHKCDEVKTALVGALNWIEKTSHEGASNNTGLIKDLRKSVVRAGKLATAAERKMCVGVYGASQAGKSYLISALARSGENPLMARYGAKTVDFLKDINPEGGGESTGLVTRFTMDRSLSPSESHPIRASLLSELDLVKILANSFVFDIKHEEEIDPAPIEEAIYSRLSELEVKANGQSPMGLEDIYDLEDYCNQKLSKNPYFQVLKKSDFWDKCSQLAPRLSATDRGQLFDLLWQDMPLFANLYVQLSGSLEKLGHARSVYCCSSVLFKEENGEWEQDKAKSIINVSALEGLGENLSETVSVMTDGNRTADIPRSQIGALVAELVISMEHQPHDFFEHTDLLDFPGARTRSPNENIPEELERSEKIAGIFLRGKVAYLFDRYSDEQELTSMLLCVGESNQEVAEVPVTVEDWISKTHGRTAEERYQGQTSLFFIMTKFDTNLAEAAGKGTDSARWKTRMDYSLIKAFQERSPKTRWVEEWTPNKPFQNLFWIRNPFHLQKGLFDYHSTDPIVEKDIRDDVKDFIAAVFDGYLKSEEVSRYFREPAPAFNAAMALNDGGVSYLIEQLEPICNPGLKREQICKSIDLIIQKSMTSLSPYYVDSDLVALSKKKRLEAVRIMRSLAVVLKRQKLGELLNHLRFAEEDAYSVFIKSEHIANSIVTGTSKDSDLVSSSVHLRSASDNIDDLLNLDPDDFGEDSEDNSESNNFASEQNGSKNAETIVHQDLAAKFTTDIESSWTEKISTLASNPAALHYYGLNEETILKLSQEIMTAAHGKGLFDKMSELVRDARQHKTEIQDSFRWKQIAPACGMFNEFIATMGYGGVFAPTGSEIRDIQDVEISIFKPGEYTGAEGLPEKATNFPSGHFLQWIQTVQFMIRENAKIQAGVAGDSNDNEALGRVLNDLNTVVSGGRFDA